jgi:hypothetical protein
MEDADLEFPINLFSKFPSLPVAGVFADLQNTFQSVFLPSCPFLKTLTYPQSTLFEAEGKPAYHTFAMAALGSASSSDQALSDWGTNLFEAAIYIHCATAERDNLTTRRLDWIASVRQTHRSQSSVRD